jgi:hypothetical protein
MGAAFGVGDGAGSGGRRCSLRRKCRISGGAHGEGTPLCRGGAGIDDGVAGDGAGGSEAEDQDQRPFADDVERRRGPAHPGEDLTRSIGPQSWPTVTWDYGAEEKASRFSHQRVRPAPLDHFHGAWPEPEGGLHMEWRDGQEKPSPYWLSTFPEQTRLAELVFAAKLRWRMEPGLSAE